MIENQKHKYSIRISLNLIRHMNCRYKQDVLVVSIKVRVIPCRTNMLMTCELQFPEIQEPRIGW
jgi:hypothetical protein